MSRKIDLLDLVIILARYKIFIISITFVVSIAAVVYSLVTPEYWRSTAIFKPIEDKTTGLHLGSMGFGLGGAILGLGQSGDLNEYLAIMGSRTFSEDVVKKFDLINYFNIKEDDYHVAMHMAIDSLRQELISISINPDNFLIYVSALTKDKNLSSSIANYYLEKIDHYNRNNRMSKGREKKEFIGKRLNEIEETIELLSNEIKNFQEEFNLLSLPDQIVTAVEIYANLFTEKINNDIELKLKRNYLSDDNPIIKTLIDKQSALERRIRSLEMEDFNQDNIKFLPSMGSIPELSKRYQSLLMNLEIQQSIYTYLYPEYEKAKIDEINDMTAIEIIDKAIPAGIRAKPRRAMICIFSFFIALVVSSIIAYTYNMFTEGDRKKKISELWIELKKI